jgi:hypothetical protein
MNLYDIMFYDWQWRPPFLCGVCIQVEAAPKIIGLCGRSAPQRCELFGPEISGVSEHPGTDGLCVLDHRNADDALRRKEKTCKDRTLREI